MSNNNPEGQPPEPVEEEEPTEQTSQAGEEPKKPPLRVEIGLRIRHPNQEENDSN